MSLKIQYIKDEAGNKIGVYIPIEEWKSLLDGEEVALKQFKGKQRKKAALDLPSHDLGSEFLPSREELYHDRSR